MLLFGRVSELPGLHGEEVKLIKEEVDVKGGYPGERVVGVTVQ